jgi:hypothetical protein
MTQTSKTATFSYRSEAERGVALSLASKFADRATKETGQRHVVSHTHPDSVQTWYIVKPLATDGAA